MDNLQILVQAILSLKDTTESKKQITSELPNLEKQLQSDKNARVKILAGLDIAKSKSLIQSQLNTITNQAKAPTIKIGIDTSSIQNTQNITNGLRDVQTQAQQTANSVQQISTVANSNHISDSMLKTLLKDMEIGKSATEEYKIALKNLLVDLKTAWNSNDLDKYNKALDNVIKKLSDGQRSYKLMQVNSDQALLAAEQLKEYQRSIGATFAGGNTQKVYIDKDLKADLISNIGSAKELKKILTSIYGAGKWTFNPEKQTQGFKNLVGIINASDASLHNFMSLFEEFSHKNYGGNNFAGYFEEAYNQIQRLKGLINDRYTKISSMFEFGDAETATRYLEEIIAKIIQLQGFNNGSSANGDWVDILTYEVQTANAEVERLGNNIQRVSSTSSKNYFSNSSEILKDIQLFDMEEDAIKSLETTFKSLGATVTSVERKNNSGFTESFTVAIRSATGEVEKFDYIWKNLNEGISDDEKWRYALSNITATDKGVKNLIESAKIAKDKLNAIADTKQNKLMSLYSGAGQGAKPIQNADSWIKLAQQAGIAEEAIEKIRTADTTTANSIKANADIEIDKFKQLVRTLQNVEYAANSLRVKDIFTTKRIETTNLDNLINKINKSDVPFEKLRRHIDVLKSSLSNVTNQESLVKYLNSFDRVESKFKSLNTLYTSIGGYDKQLDKLARDWQKQGIYIGNVKTTVENLKKSLATVKTSDGFTKWVSDFNSQIGALDKLPITIAKGRNELNSLQQTWTDFSKGKNIVSNVNKELGNLSSRIKRITTEKGFSKWSEDFSKINTQISQMTTNLNNQVSVQNKINKLQTQIAKLNPARDIDEIARLNKKLKLEQKELSNLQYQSNLFSNLISLAEQEKYITQQTVQTREMLTSAINSSTAKYKSDINETIKNLNRLKNSTLFKNNQNNSQVTAIQQQITDLTTRYQNMLNTLNKGNLTPTQFDALQKELKQLNTDFNSTETSAQRFQQTLRSDNSAVAQAQKVEFLKAKLQALYKANTRASGKFGSQFDALFNALNAPNLDSQEISRITKEMQILEQQIKASDKAGKSFFDNLREKVKKFTGWMSMTYAFSMITRTIRSTISEVVALDTALVDLKKTFSGTSSELQGLYYSANRTAKNLGVTTKEILEQASAWSRLGYSSAEASELMSKNSAIFKTISPGMDLDTATDGLVSMMKAFGIEADNVLDGIMSKVNIVGNKFATDNTSIVEAMTRSSSAMAAANNTLEETIALNTASIEITRNAETTANAWRTVSMRLRGKILPPYKEIYMQCT